MAAGAGWRAQAAEHARGRRLARQVEGGRGQRAEHGVRIVRLTEQSTVPHGRRRAARPRRAAPPARRGAVIEIGEGTFVDHRTELVAHDHVRSGRDCLLARVVREGVTWQE